LLCLGVALVLLAGGAAWFFLASPTDHTDPVAGRAAALTPSVVATLDSPVFSFSPTWTVSEAGADPHEPAEPWTTPSGELRFSYTGRELALLMAVGDYWGYLYVTVDGAPANRLAVIPGNRNSLGERAGYRTLYAPERQGPDGPTPQWVVVHRAADDGPHDVRIELWRSWGQTPLRAVAVDAPATPRPRWPGVALLAAGGWLLVAAVWAWGWPPPAQMRPHALHQWMGVLLRPVAQSPVRMGLAVAALGLLAPAVALGLWWLTAAGLALLGYVALAQPSLWVAVLLFGLPFYFSQTLPVLPGRATNLIELGLLGGLVVIWLHRRLVAEPGSRLRLPAPLDRWARALGWTLAALVTWALVAAVASEYPAPALREWRTVFLASGLFALLLMGVLAGGAPGTRTLLVIGWLAGATMVASVGLWHFAGGTSVIQAEGVQRIRAFYGSPNNLALYLERTLMVALAYGLLLPWGRARVLAGIAALIQGVALLLTFSKGSLLLGLPAGLATLWLGGLVALRVQGASRRALWWLAAAAGMGLVLLLPFLGTERFQRLLDFSQGTGLFRLLLWRSALQMALDHPLLGVGPDNFLYVFRSGYLLPAAWQEPNLNHPHNWLLDWWTRLGLPGLALGAAFFVTGCGLIWGRLRRTPAGPPQTTALWLGLLAATVAALVHGLIDLSYAAPDLMLVWVLMFYLAAAPVKDE
jgi:O-antigen ligase